VSSRLSSSVEVEDIEEEPLEQRWAEEMLASGELKHNPNLSGTMGANIAHYSATKTFEPEEVLEDLIHDRVYDDEEYDWGNKANILNKNYTRVSIGVAFEEGGIYLVQDFS
jgi:uncharacterized protein YkwD